MCFLFFTLTRDASLHAALQRDNIELLFGDVLFYDGCPLLAVQNFVNDFRQSLFDFKLYSHILCLRVRTCLLPPIQLSKLIKTLIKNNRISFFIVFYMKIIINQRQNRVNILQISPDISIFSKSSTSDDYMIN